MSRSDSFSSSPPKRRIEGMRGDVRAGMVPGTSISSGHQSTSVKTCSICGSPLSVHERAVGTICSTPECKLAHVRATTQAENERVAEIWERVIELDESLAATQSTSMPVGASQPEPSPSPRVLGVLPSNDRKLTVLPKRRRTVFVDRLMGIISQAAAVRLGNAELQDDGVGYEESDSPTEKQLAILGNGCAVCRGNCCSQGSGHAFIHVDTILKYMDSNPEKRPRDVLEDYLSRIGSKTYEDSCVYHCEKGCSLPREMRSKVCNGYLCKGLGEILYKLEERPVDKALVIAVSDYYPDQQRGGHQSDQGESKPTKGFVRAALIDPTGLELYQCDDDDRTDHNCTDSFSEK